MKCSILAVKPPVRWGNLVIWFGLILIHRNFMMLLCNIIVAEISLGGVVLVLTHLEWRHAIGVLVINSTCKHKRNSGNPDVIQVIQPPIWIAKLALA